MFGKRTVTMLSAGLVTLWAGVSAAATQFEIMASGGAGRGTETFHSDDADFTVLTAGALVTYYFKPLEDKGGVPLELLRFLSRPSRLFADFSWTQRELDEFDGDRTATTFGAGGEGYFPSGTGVGASYFRSNVSETSVDGHREEDTNYVNLWVDQYLGTDHNVELRLKYRGFDRDTSDGQETRLVLTWKSAFGRSFWFEPSIAIGRMEVNPEWERNMDWNVYQAGLDLGFFLGKYFTLYFGGGWTGYRGEESPDWFDTIDSYRAHLSPVWWFGPQAALRLDVEGGYDKSTGAGADTERKTRHVSGRLSCVVRF